MERRPENMDILIYTLSEALEPTWQTNLSSNIHTDDLSERMSPLVSPTQKTMKSVLNDTSENTQP